MAFDQTTRNRLQKLVSDCRKALSDEFCIQVQQIYGLDPSSGDVTPLDRLSHLSDRERQTAQILRDTLEHYLASEARDREHTIAAIDRIIREQAFTVLNRLAALLMMEARGIVRPSVSHAEQSQASELYKYVAGSALGETGDAYRTFLFSLFDEFAQDLPSLFDRFAPQGRLFPRAPALLQVLELLNHHDTQSFWGEDETIGWIYQYFNSKEERKAMRDASQAPRNSRELAVRNQFFTPRYVVEFLVENTLGRLWFNATGGQTVLRDRCQYLLVKPNEQPEAAKRLRDPRTLKLLDPACGSMHFGLYAFDLFSQIYCEAWDWEQEHGPGALDISTQPAANFKPLSHTYADIDAYLRDVPRLIIEHNIYGVDIDPRAAQIASLALWLRAQRAWHDAGVKAEYRPLIGRGHVVAAEAPPAEKDLCEKFALQLDKQDADLFEKTLRLLKGLPELGLLLQIEKELPKLVRQIYGGGGAGGLFSEMERENWQLAEKRLLHALNEFTQTSKTTYKGRLFSHDALQGFKIIDICKEAFDVVVMNPPFGSNASGSDDYLRSTYPLSYYDLYATFVDRMSSLLSTGGFVGCITSKTFFSTSRLLNFRKWLLLDMGFDICADLGQGVLDNATVETAAYVLNPQGCSNNIVFIDLSKSTNKDFSLQKSMKSETQFTYCVERNALVNFPNVSLSSYWGSQSLLSMFNNYESLDPSFADTAAGQMTGDDFRFVRARWEVSADSSVNWKTFAKGGEFFRYICDWPLVINWGEDALVEYRKQTVRSVLISKRSAQYSGRAALVWNRVNEIGFNVRILPCDSKFSDKAPAIFPKDNPLGLLALLCSRIVDQLCALQNPNRMFEVRDVSSLPIPDNKNSYLSKLAEEIVAIKMEWLSRSENSIYFCCISNNLKQTTTLRDSFNSEKFLALQHQNQIQVNQGLIDNYADLLYKVTTTDSKILADMLGSPRRETISKDLDPESDGYNITSFSRRIVSYLIGAVFGRWDIRFSTGERKKECLPDPFLPLPYIPPGILDASNNYSLKFEEPLPHYPLAIPQLGILVDDARHPNDIAGLIRLALREIWENNADFVEDEICAALSVNSIRDYIRKPSGFFTDHLGRCSGNGRKAPIFWPIGSKSGAYSIWLYYSKLSNQTLYSVINDYIEPKLRQTEIELTALRVRKGARNHEDEQQLESLALLEHELIELRDTLLNIAPAYHPNQDDGVQICAAPLWAFFRHKVWQKVLKDTWIKLEKGDYDWSHLAMNYWPERVHDKCRTDKSLATIHGLVAIYVEPEAKPKRAKSQKSASSAE